MNVCVYILPGCYPRLVIVQTRYSVESIMCYVVRLTVAACPGKAIPSLTTLHARVPQPQITMLLTLWVSVDLNTEPLSLKGGAALYGGYVLVVDLLSSSEWSCALFDPVARYSPRFRYPSVIRLGLGLGFVSTLMIQSATAEGPGPSSVTCQHIPRHISRQIPTYRCITCPDGELLYRMYSSHSRDTKHNSVPRPRPRPRPCPTVVPPASADPSLAKDEVTADSEDPARGAKPEAAIS
jgi:hypothetical protein